MKMNRNSIKTLLQRFSCSLIGRGKKIAGHKILLESLFAVRKKNEKDLLSLSIALSEREPNQILDIKTRLQDLQQKVLLSLPQDKVQNIPQGVYRKSKKK